MGTTESELELQVLVCASMLSQIFLLLWTYMRKKSSSSPWIRIFWIGCYLSANYVAVRSLGNIFQKALNPDSRIDHPRSKYLIGVWAQFVLLHLGGYSKLTAFTLEDNEAWSRHAIQFLFHEALALYVCIRACEDESLRFLLISSFIMGTFRFFERVSALKRGSMNGLRNAAMENSYAVFPENHYRNQDIVQLRHGDPLEPAIQIEVLPHYNTDSNLDFLSSAYESFQNYKGLYMDYCCPYRNEDRFAELDLSDCIRFMEIELNFAYDLFYTKTTVSHTKVGWVMKLANVILVVAAVVLFNRIETNGFANKDLYITHALLILALVLELFSFVESVLAKKTVLQISNCLQQLQSLPGITLILLWSGIPSRWWNSCQTGWWRSSKIGQHSLLEFCFKDRKSWSWLKCLLAFFHVKQFLESYWYTSYATINESFKIQIFDEVKIKLLGNQLDKIINFEDDIFNMHTDKGFEYRLVTWHIVTDLCFTSIVHEQEPYYLRQSKTLSDYMLYLMSEHPALLSPVVTLDLKCYQEARDAASKHFKMAHNNVMNLRNAFNLLFHKNVPPILDNAIKLFYLLEQRRRHDTDIWENLLKFWVGMLSYAAIHSKGKHHAEVIGTGGELFTLVWLYTVHLKKDS